MPNDDEEDEVSVNAKPYDSADGLPIGVVLAELGENLLISETYRVENAVFKAMETIRAMGCWYKWERTAEAYGEVLHANIVALSKMFGEVRMCRLCGEAIVFFRAKGHVTLVLGADTGRLHEDECNGRHDE